MSLKIHPSPSILVKADTPIIECIQLMNSKDVGSLLITAEKGPEDLVGIFTERDLLKKLEYIIAGSLSWRVPIRTVMSSPVYTLDVSGLDIAAEIMVSRRIRHLPITSLKASTGGKTLVGMISMRDLFKIFVEKQGSHQIPNLFEMHQMNSGLKVHIAVKDPALIELSQKVIDLAFGVSGQCVDILNDVVQSEDVLIIDLDTLPVATWVKFLKARNRSGKLKLAIILFSPSLQTDRVVHVLEKVGQSQRFCALKKPVDILQFREALSSIS